MFFISSTLAINMPGVGKIELFKFTQKTYQHIGIYPPASDQNRCPIKSKTCFVPFSLAICLSLSVAYFFSEANSMIEYGMSFYSTISLTLFITEHLLIFWQMQNILNFIGNCERFVEKRAYSI